MSRLERVWAVAILRKIDREQCIKFEEFHIPRNTSNEFDPVLLKEYLDFFKQNKFVEYGKFDDLYYITHKGVDFINGVVFDALGNMIK